jgi:hypothetical protein
MAGPMGMRGNAARALRDKVCLPFRSVHALTPSSSVLNCRSTSEPCVHVLAVWRVMLERLETGGRGSIWHHDNEVTSLERLFWLEVVGLR